MLIGDKSVRDLTALVLRRQVGARPSSVHVDRRRVDERLFGVSVARCMLVDDESVRDFSALVLLDDDKSVRGLRR